MKETTIGNYNIIIGSYAGQDLGEENNLQFIFTVPIIDSKSLTEYRTTMTMEEYEVVNKIVKRALDSKRNIEPSELISSIIIK